MTKNCLPNIFDFNLNMNWYLFKFRPQLSVPEKYLSAFENGNIFKVGFYK